MVDSDKAAVRIYQRDIAIGDGPRRPLWRIRALIKTDRRDGFSRELAQIDDPDMPGPSCRIGIHGIAIRICSRVSIRPVAKTERDAAQSRGALVLAPREEVSVRDHMTACG